MKQYEVIIEWYNEMWYGKNKKHAAEVMGSKRLYDQSIGYIAGFCQAKADQGYGVSIKDYKGITIIHGLLVN